MRTPREILIVPFFSATIWPAACSQGEVALAGLARVSTLTVVLNSSLLNVGQTTQAVAMLKDSVGNALTGRAVTRSSGSPASATVMAMAW